MIEPIEPSVVDNTTEKLKMLVRLIEPMIKDKPYMVPMSADEKLKYMKDHPGADVVIGGFAITFPKI